MLWTKRWKIESGRKTSQTNVNADFGFNRTPMKLILDIRPSSTPKESHYDIDNPKQGSTEIKLIFQ